MGTEINMISFLLSLILLSSLSFVNGNRYNQCITETNCGPIPEMGCVYDPATMTNFCAPKWNLEKKCLFDWQCPDGSVCREYTKKTQRLFWKIKLCMWLIDWLPKN